MPVSSWASQQYDTSCTLDGKPSVALTVYQLPGSNALATARGVYAKMAELKQRFPEGLDYQIVCDTTPFITESIDEVFLTLRDAVILVAAVVLVFLQNWRAAIIPLVAVPVAIIGAFGAMAALGFSLNNLTLFGLVLAIGIVVDDAIVVVENVERWLEQGLEPREAARRAMDEVTGPVIAVALVLAAVFVPCAFLGGITGQFFRQFAVTIAVSTAFRAFNSLTLSPALAAILLKKRGARRDLLTRLLDLLLGWFFGLFNRVFNAGTAAYTWIVGRLLRGSALVLLVYAGLLLLTYLEMLRVPKGFIPQQDKGYLMLNVQLPDSASVERTMRMMARIEQVARQTPGVAHTVGIAGQSLILNANAPNLGSMYVMLKPFGQRPGATAIAAALDDRCRQAVRGAVTALFSPPPIEALGTTGGFKLIIEDRGNLGIDELAAGGQRNCSPGKRRAWAARAVQQFKSQLAVAVPGHRPRQMHDAGSAGERRVQYAAVLPEQLLRQQFQRVRPHLAGEYRGRAALPRPGPRPPPASGAQQPERHGRAGDAAAGAQHERPGAGAELQSVRGGGDHRQPGAGDQLGEGCRPHGADRSADAAAINGLRVDGTDVPAEPGRQHGNVRIRVGRGIRIFGARGAV